MRLKTVRARQGVQWVRAGFRVFLRQPLAFAGLYALIGLAFWLLSLLPLVGPVLALSLPPLATAIFMLATRETLAGRAPRFALVLAPLREPQQRSRLLQLGAMYAVATLAVLVLAQLLDGSSTSVALNAPVDADAASHALREPGFLLLLMALMALLSLVFWHAPGLVCWADLGPAKAVFASVVACWRARAAFALYGITWFGLLFGFMLAAQLLLALIGRPQAIGQAMLPAGLLFSTVVYASVYFSFVDSFEQEETLPPPTGA